MEQAAQRGVEPLESGPARPRVSIVIVSWNALAVVRRCLPSVVATAYPNLEIIFADNASDDGSADWVASMFPGVRVVRHPENWAFCRGNNQALKIATGEFVVLLNNDVEVPPDWLDPLVRALETEPGIGAAQPKMLDFEKRDRLEYSGAAGGFLDRNGYPFARGRLFTSVEDDRGQYDDDIDVFWATGAAFITRKDLYEELGGFDERLFMHMEEIDYCWRLQRAGYRIVCRPSSHVFHIGGASLKQGSSRKTYLNYRNNLLVLYKNLPPAEWRRVLAARVLLDVAGIARALVLLKWGEAIEIVRAYAHAHRMKNRFTGDRPDPDADAVLPSYRGNVVVDYFLRGRRTFGELPPGNFAPGTANGADRRIG